MAPEPRKPNLWELSDLATPWCLHVAATLRIANHIHDGHTHIADLARAAGADAELLQRVLRQLVQKGLFEEPSPGVFALNEFAKGLLHPAMLYGLDLEGFGGRMAHAWNTLLDAVRTGAPAYYKAFGRPFWEDLQANPKIAEDFDALMGPGHGTPDPDVLVDNDWPSIKTVVDVGGGTGSLLAEVLRAHPHLRGMLVDFPSTVARSGPVFAATGVADRVTTVGQSFFEALPRGGDLYMMKSIIADWADPEALAILTRCAEAARPNGRVVIVNGVSPDEDGPATPALLMMVLVGGKSRTLTEFRALANQAGLAVRATARRSAGRFLVECVTR